MSVLKLATSIAAGLVIVLQGTAIAQSPDPRVIQQLCVTFQHSPDTVITPTDLASQIASGDVLVTMVETASACAPVAPITPTLNVDESTTYDLFIEHGAHVEGRLNTLRDAVSSAIDASKYNLVPGRATTLANYLKTAISWLDDNPPQDCYADAWQGTRDAFAMWRKAYLDAAYGAKHSVVSRIRRASDEIDKGNDLYDATDYDAASTACGYWNLGAVAMHDHRIDGQR